MSIHRRACPAVLGLPFAVDTRDANWAPHQFGAARLTLRTSPSGASAARL
jgi:hypothetical protein